MSSEQEFHNKEENPYTSLLPQEANQVFQDIFSLIPINSGEVLHAKDSLTLANRHNSELSDIASKQLLHLLEASNLTNSGIEFVVKKFDQDFIMGRYLKADRQNQSNRWSEALGWNDSKGGMFGENAEIIEQKLYRMHLGSLLMLQRLGEKMRETIFNSDDVRNIKRKEKIISQRLIDDALHYENPTSNFIKKWREELIEKYQDEP